MALTVCQNGLYGKQFYLSIFGIQISQAYGKVNFIEELKILSVTPMTNNEELKHELKCKVNVDK